MTPAIDTIVTRAIPELARAGLENGTLRLFGSVIRDESGRIAFHLQETAQLSAAAGPHVALAMKAVDIVSSVANNFQQEINRRGIARVEDGIALLQQTGIANLALSGAGLGVAVAGFALMSHKLNSIERRTGGIEDGLAQIGTKLDEVRVEQGRALVSRLRGLANLYAESWEISDPAKAESSWTRVYQDGAELEENFHDRARADLSGTSGTTGMMAADPHLDAFAMVSGLRIAAQLAAGEVESARALERRSAGDMLRLTGSIGLADLVLPALAGAEPGSPAWDLARGEALDTHRPTLTRLRQRESLLATRTAFVPLLERYGATPREWLQMARSEQEAPVLVLEGPQEGVLPA